MGTAGGGDGVARKLCGGRKIQTRGGRYKAGVVGPDAVLCAAVPRRDQSRTVTTHDASMYHAGKKSDAISHVRAGCTAPSSTRPSSTDQSAASTAVQRFSAPGCDGYRY